MKLDTLDRRFADDPTWRALVTLLESAILTLDLSPSEIREAAMYACFRVECGRHPACLCGSREHAHCAEAAALVRDLEGPQPPTSRTKDGMGKR